MKLEIGERIRLRRAELGMSQSELAKAVGMSHQTSISKIEIGERGVPLKYIKLIATALKTTPEYLLGDTNDPEEVLVPQFVRQNGDGKLDEISAFGILLSEENRKRAISYMKFLYQEQMRTSEG